MFTENYFKNLSVTFLFKFMSTKFNKLMFENKLRSSAVTKPHLNIYTLNKVVVDI